MMSNEDTPKMGYNRALEIIERRMNFLRRRALGVDEKRYDHEELYALQTILKRLAHVEKEMTQQARHVLDLQNKRLVGPDGRIGPQNAEERRSAATKERIRLRNANLGENEG